VEEKSKLSIIKDRVWAEEVVVNSYTGLLPAEIPGMLFLIWNWISVLVTADQTIRFQAFKQLLFQLFMVAFVLLLHLVSNNILFIPGKLTKQMELAHHDLHDSN
jgi:hypothetical protein